jgi:hypothetical protein
MVQYVTPSRSYVIISMLTNSVWIRRLGRIVLDVSLSGLSFLLAMMFMRVCRCLSGNWPLASILALRVSAGYFRDTAGRHHRCHQLHHPELPVRGVTLSSSFCSADRLLHHGHNAGGHARSLSMLSPNRVCHSGSRICCAPNRLVSSPTAPTRRYLMKMQSPSAVSWLSQCFAKAAPLVAGALLQNPLAALL